MKRGTAVALLLAACGGTDEVPADNPSDASPDTVPVVMPDFPDKRPGQLTVRTATNNPSYELAGSWDAIANRCQDPTIVQLIVQREDFGVILLLGPPADEGDLGDFEIQRGNREIPDTATARIGVQLFALSSQTHVFRGAGGSVEVSELGPMLSGRVGARIVENSFLDTVLLAASFDVPLDNASDDWCQVVSRRPEVRTGGGDVPLRGRRDGG